MSFRALSPVSESRVPHAETPRPSNGLSSKAAQGHRFLASAGSIPRTGSACRSERSFSGPLPGGLGGSVRGSRGAEALHTSKTVYGLPTSRSRPALPSEQWRPERGTIAATRTGRPTRSLKRTAEAFSGDSGLWSLSLRGAARAFMGRSLSSYTLAGLNFFYCFLNGKLVP